MNATTVLNLLKQTFLKWLQDRVARMGAALAFYTIFSLVPLLLIAIGIAGTVFGEQAAQGKVVDALAHLLDRPTALTVENVLKQNQENPGSNTLASLLGAVLVLLGASGVFIELEDALNNIWQVPAERSGTLLAFVRDRLLSFGLVVGLGLMMLVLLVAGATLSAASRLLPPSSVVGDFLVWRLGTLVVSFLFLTLLFAMIYRWVPNARVAWNDVWAGAVGAAVLFTAGKYLLVLYLTRSGVASAYGVAGSLVVILLWVFFSTQVLLFGAEFTHLYALQHGSLHTGAIAGPKSPAVSEPVGTQVHH